MGRGWDCRRLHHAPSGAWSEGDPERAHRRGEEPWDQGSARDRDREQKCCEYPLLPAHVFPPPADNIPGGFIGRKVVALDIKGGSS